MRLLTGPAGSGKTYRVLQQFREALRRRDDGVRLLTPTATMAAHMQNQLAREGLVFRPALIQTLSRFVDSFAVAPPQVSGPLQYLLVEEAARRVARPEFASVIATPGFCAALARTIDEFASAGCDAENLAAALPRAAGTAPLGEAFLAVYREVERALQLRGVATRAQRLLSAAQQIARDGLHGTRTIWLDGFYALPDPELAVIEALCHHAEVTLTLPSAQITDPVRQSLLAIGFAEEMCDWKPAAPRVQLFEAPSIEREANDIARRILDEAAAGCAFRDVGVIVRCPEIYEAVLRATFDRFGIPARFYFDAELSHHPLLRYLAGAMDALLGGWDHAQTLAAIRMAPGVPSDEFDFAVRQQLPGHGLEPLQRIAGDMGGGTAAVLNELQELAEWLPLSLLPTEWSARLKSLRNLFHPGRPEPGDTEATSIRRGQSTVLELFEAAMDEVARALAPEPVPLPSFWHAAKSVLRLTPLRVADHRRNVVHVLGAHEARQWQLPVVFVCGLVEKQFPKFHAPEPFFPESARLRLKQSGIRLRSAADFEAEECFLFDWAATRGTQLVTVSYPRFDTRGQQNLRSLYLEGLEATPTPWHAVRPQPGRAGVLPPASLAIVSPDLTGELARRHLAFRPTALESYLQCPFQFFGRHTLRLDPAPPRPEERLSAMVEGTIIHDVLAEIACCAGPLEQVFDGVFQRVCQHVRIPGGYRAEACRQRLLADLEAFAESNHWPGGNQSCRPELKFEFELDSAVRIKGRIDRLDVDLDGRVRVVDYKYSSAANTRKRVKEEGHLQPQLYVLAAERMYPERVAGMHYCGLRGGVEWGGWTAPFPDGWLDQAVAAAVRSAAEIRAGRVAPAPDDPEQCPRCEFRDACRYEAAAPTGLAVAGEG